MPNHIHIVLLPIVKRGSSRPKSSDINIAQQFPVLVNIMKRIKGATARESNLVLGRSGKF